MIKTDMKNKINTNAVVRNNKNKIKSFTYQKKFDRLPLKECLQTPRNFQ